MPPKRKLKAEIAQPDVSKSSSTGDRATRSSTRGDIVADTSLNQTLSPPNKNKENKGGSASKRSSGANKARQQNIGNAVPPEPPSKKAKRGSTDKAKTEDASLEGARAAVKGKSSTSKAKHPAYTKTRMQKLFEKYADAEDPSYIGADGLERLCVDGNISMEGPQPLILAWFLQASELGKFTKEEWLKGCDLLRTDTIEKLSLALAEHESQLIFDKAVESNGTISEPYNRRAMYGKHHRDVSTAFDQFYKFIFSLAKPPQERNIDAEIARTFWLTVLAPKYPMVQEFVEYVEKHTTLRGVNKDLWAMVLEFFRSSSCLENYEADGEWPTLIDGFVAWRNSADSNMVDA